MSYLGQPFSLCSNRFSIDPRTVTIVYVEGSSLNPCGHVLLRFRGKVRNVEGLHYFHIPGFGGNREDSFLGFYDHPYYLDESGFITYMKTSEKRFNRVFELQVSFPNPESAKTRIENKLCELVEKPYLWGILFHNCQSFIEKIVNAGKGTFYDFTGVDCPRLDIAIHSIAERILGSTNKKGKLGKNAQFIDFLLE